jgi:hypothetical protein
VGLRASAPLVTVLLGALLGSGPKAGLEVPDPSPPSRPNGAMFKLLQPVATGCPGAPHCRSGASFGRSVFLCRPVRSDCAWSKRRSWGPVGRIMGNCKVLPKALSGRGLGRPTLGSRQNSGQGSAPPAEGLSGIKSTPICRRRRLARGGLLAAPPRNRPHP